MRESLSPTVTPASSRASCTVPPMRVTVRLSPSAMTTTWHARRISTWVSPAITVSRLGLTSSSSFRTMLLSSRACSTVSPT